MYQPFYKNIYFAIYDFELLFRVAQCNTILKGGTLGYAHSFLYQVKLSLLEISVHKTLYFLLYQVKIVSYKVLYLV